MKTNHINRILVAFLVVIMTACSNDFLNVEPKGQVESSVYLKTSDEAFSALMGVYDLMQRNYNVDWNSAFVIKNFPGDDCNAGSTEGDQPAFQELDDLTYNASNTGITAMWSGYYFTINAANTVINKVVPGNDANMKVIVAEAKAIRAFSYLELVTMYGDVPLITVNAANISDPVFNTARTPKAEVYAQIEKDLNEAILLLPLKSAYAGTDKFRFSKGAAQTTLGKALLYQKKYDAAATELDKVIASGEYSLTPDYATIWDKEQELGVESIFEIMFTGEEKYDWGTFPWGKREESNIHVQLMGPRGENFTLGSTGLVNGWGFNLPTKKIVDAYIAAGDVVRRKASVMTEAELLAAGGTLKVEASTIHDYEGAIRVKYATRASETNGPVSELNYTTNWRIMRYADVLLLAAEAHMLKTTKDEAKASALISQVRSRVSLPGISLTGSALFNALVTERQLEFSFEGQRFFDMVRWGKGSEIPGFTVGKNELFPIPANEIIANTAIEATNQNPGF